MEGGTGTRSSGTRGAGRGGGRHAPPTHDAPPGTAPSVRRDRHRQQNSRWPTPGGGGGGIKDNAGKRGASSGKTVKRASTSPSRGKKKYFELQRSSMPPPQWWASGGLDPILSDDSVGALVASHVMRRDKFEALAEVKTSVRERYAELPPLTAPGPSGVRRPTDNRRAATSYEPLRRRSYEPSETHTSEYSFQDDAVTAPREWNKRTALARYRGVAREQQHTIHARRRSLMESTVEAFRGATESAEELAARDEKTLWRRANLQARLPQVLQPTQDLDLRDPTLQYLLVKRTGGWDKGSIRDELRSQGLMNLPPRPATTDARFFGREGFRPMQETERVVEETPGVEDGYVMDAVADEDRDEGYDECSIVEDAVSTSGLVDNDAAAESNDDSRRTGWRKLLPPTGDGGARKGDLKQSWVWSDDGAGSLAGKGRKVAEEPKPGGASPSVASEESSAQYDSDDADEMEGPPTLWAAASNHPASISIVESSNRRGVVARLHPLFLLKCGIVGERLLAAATAHRAASDDPTARPVEAARLDSFQEASVGSDSGARVVPIDGFLFGLRANGYEELLLLEVRRSVPDWGLGPMERGIFEREIDAENERRSLPPGALRTRLDRVRTLPQLCVRVAVVETRPRRRPLSRGASRLDLLHPSRLFSAASRASHRVARDPNDDNDSDREGDSSSESAVSLAQSSHPSEQESLSEEGERERNTRQHGDTTPPVRSGKGTVSFYPTMDASGREEDEDGRALDGPRCDSRPSARVARTSSGQSPQRELVLNSANAILTSYDVPAILHVMGWHGRQVFGTAMLSVNAGGRQDATLHEVLNNERKIATRLLDNSWNVLVHSSGGSMEEEVSYHSILSSAVERLGGPTLRTLSITRLIITGSEIDDAGVASLVLGLRSMASLKSLDLSDNPALTWRSCVPLAELLDTNHRPEFCYPKHSVLGCGVCQLDTLVLNGLPIGGRGIELLAPKLGRNRHLRTLSLQRVGLQRAGAIALSHIMQENITLEELRLGWNQVLHSSADVIANALSTNASLLRLELSNTGLGEAGGMHFVMALSENQKLQEFDLSNNGIGPRSCLVLSESLARNESLRVLILDRNPLGGEGGTHLVVGLMRNQGLQRMGLQGVSFVDYVEIGGSHRVLFDRVNPNGQYSLDLSDPAERQIATELVHLRAALGSETWVNVQFNGKSYKGPADRDAWPERMPLFGTLKLTYAADVLAMERYETISDRAFETLMDEFSHEEAVDFWRLSLVRVATSVAFFTAEHAIRLLRCFQWSDDRVEACIMLFCRISAARRLVDVTNAMSQDEQRRLFSRLGMAAYLRSENPTGRYNLNLGRQLERIVAQRLLMQAQVEPHWRGQRTLCNFRNVILQGVPVQIKDPMNFQLPTTGFMQFDFIVYSKGAILEAMNPLAALRRRPRPIDALNFLRLIGAVQALKELEAQLAARAAGLPAPSPSAPAPDSTTRADGGTRLMKAVRTIMMARTDLSSGAGLFSALVQKGLNLRDMLAASEAKEAEREKESRRSYVSQDQLKDIIEKVDREAQDMAQKMAAGQASSQPKKPSSVIGASDSQPSRRTSPSQSPSAASSSASLHRSSNQSSPRTTDEGTSHWRGVGLRELKGAVGRTTALNMMHQGLAKIFDLSIPDVSPLAVVRAFANRHYCTCQQVLQLLCVFDKSLQVESTQRVSLMQVLFPRVIDLEHFGDVLRNCSPSEQVQIMRRVGFLNCVHTHREEYGHLHGVVFVIRMSVEEEFRAAKALAHHAETVPKAVLPGGRGVHQVFNGLQVNGTPAVVGEGEGFWGQLCTLARNRDRPDETWDPNGTLEFQLLYPRKWRKEEAARMIQRSWLGHRGRRIAQRRRDAHIQAIQSSKAGMSAAGLLAKPPANALLGRVRATAAGKR